MLVLISLSLGVLVVFALGGLVARARPKSRARVTPEDPRTLPAPPPRVSVIVPARNEEKVLGACLESLSAQDYPDLEIVCIDDRSTDATADILAGAAARDPRVVALRGEEPPEGWYGKPNAVRQAILRASGEWLLMTDADTVHGPTSVRSAVGYAIAESIAAVSVLPRMECRGFWANLLAPQLGALLVVGRSTRRVNDAKDDAVFANGQYFLVRRDAYEAAGGIAAVKDEIDEDVAFARALKRAGLGYHFVEGETICRGTLYSTLGEFYAGFGRNAWATMGRSVAKLLKLTVVLVTMSLVPISAAVASAIALATGSPELPTWALALGVAQYPAVLAIQANIRARAGFPAYLALFAPLGGLVAWSILAYSAYKGLTGSAVTWKGRAYGARRAGSAGDPSA